MQSAAYADSALLEPRRGLKYKVLAAAFSYPDASFFDFFPGLLSEEEKRDLPAEYDRLFRAAGIWLYGAEHTAANEYEKARTLADIMGFYRALGVEPAGDRPDELSRELEFMHYLAFKQSHAAGRGWDSKAQLCLAVQRDFFAEHLLPAATKIAEAVLAQDPHDFYRESAGELLEFLASEKKLLGIGADSSVAVRFAKAASARVAEGSENAAFAEREATPVDLPILPRRRP